MIGSVTAAPAAGRRSTRDRVVVVGLGTAVAYGALAQGGYYAGQAVTVMVLVGVAAAATVAVPFRPVPRAVAVPALCWVLFGLWSLGSGLLAGDPAAALPTVGAATCIAAAAVAVAGLPADARRVLLSVLLGAAAVVAASCWVGVALHLEPLALPSSGLWRGASTITYANASAAFLVMALVLVAVTQPVRHRLASDGLAAVLLLGLATTMSRAGALGLVVACATLLVLTGRPGTAEVRRVARVVAAAGAGFAGLLPALTVGSPPQPLIAPAGLLVGGAILVLAQRVRPVLLVAAVATLLLAVLLVAVDPLRAIATSRLTTASAERADLTRVTAGQLWSAPLTGVGPGQLDLRYVDHTGTRVRAVHTHDEYLQTAAETGLVGLGLVVAGLVVLAVHALRLRTRDGRAAVAVLAAFAVHSAFDFLWHVPVLPLLLVLIVVALIGPSHPDERRNHEDEAEAGRGGRPRAGAQRRAGGIGRGGQRARTPPAPGGR